AAHEGDRMRLMRFLAITLGLGAVFLLIKAIEYRSEWVEHLVPGRAFHVDRPDADQVELFFVFYFIMTGLHAVHMIIGIGVLTVLLLMARRRKFSKDYYSPVEMSGLYWHFVDIVWIFLYPTLYIVGTH